MKVKIKEFPNGYSVKTADDRWKVGNIYWEGVPVNIQNLEIEVEHVEIEDNTAYLET